MKQKSTLFNLLPLLVGWFCFSVLAPAAMAVPSWLFHTRGAFTGGGGTLPAASDVLAWYALESAGTDASPNGYNLSLVGTPAHGAGQVGNCFTNDNASEWYSRTSAVWMSPLGDFSYVGWIRASDATPAANDSIFSHYNTSSDMRAWLVRLSTTGKIEALISGDGTLPDVRTSTFTVSDNTWTHFAIVFKVSTSIKIYINGSLDSTHTTSIPAAVYQNSTASLAVGTSSAGSSATFVGDMDEIALFDVALTDSEVAALADPTGGAGGTGITFTDLP